MKRTPLKTLIASVALPAALLAIPAIGQAEPFGDDNPGPPMHIAQGEGGRGGMGHGRGPEMMMEQLGLSPAQSEKLRSLKQQGQGESQNLHQQLRTKRQALMQYIKSPDASEAKAMAMQAELNQLQNRMSTLRLKTWFQMREILTPEQLQKMQHIKRERGGPGGMKRGGGQPR